MSLWNHQNIFVRINIVLVVSKILLLFVFCKCIPLVNVTIENCFLKIIFLLILNILDLNWLIFDIFHLHRRFLLYWVCICHIRMDMVGVITGSKSKDPQLSGAKRDCIYQELKFTRSKLMIDLPFLTQIVRVP